MNPDLERLLDNYGTALAPHIGRSLRAHLIGTFEILKAWGNDQDVCVAGLFHSIYGTEVYTRASAELGERDTIRRAIGDRAEELAYLFCACDRRHMLSNVDRADAFVIHDRFGHREVSLDRGTLAALVEIGFANELEQLPDDADLGSSRYGPWRRRWTQCVAFLSVAAREALQTRLDGPKPRGISASGRIERKAMAIRVESIRRGQGLMSRALLDEIGAWERLLFAGIDVVVEKYAFERSGFANVLVWRDDVLVSFLTTIKREALFDGRRVILGGVSSVMTPPQHQGNGYATQALREAKRVIFDEIGADCGALLCEEGLVPFYTRRGWDTVACRVEITQPGGKEVWPERMMLLSEAEVVWQPRAIDLCGLPF